MFEDTPADSSSLGVGAASVDETLVLLSAAYNPLRVIFVVHFPLMWSS